MTKKVPKTSEVWILDGEQEMVIYGPEPEWHDGELCIRAAELHGNCITTAPEPVPIARLTRRPR